MKKPMPPPDYDALIEKLEHRSLVTIINTVSSPMVRGRYLHWDKLRHLPPPGDLTHEEWWLGLKFHRKSLAKPIPLRDTKGELFRFAEPEPVNEWLHELDMGAGGIIQMPTEITNPDTRDRYWVSSLIEEAITSSQLEGAATTRDVAKEMLRTNRTPRDKSEQMILNNFLTMKRIGELADEALTPKLVFEIHRIITMQTLDEPSAAGRFRNENEDIAVWTQDNLLLHRPPKASELEKRMSTMCAFANGELPTYFIHPILRAIILHFWLAYDHPFYDGNGRTARALFYWAMLHHKYWLFEFIAISSILRKAPAKYAKSFLYTECDENDLTYFIIYQLDVIRRAITELHQYINRKTRQLKAVEGELKGVEVLNHRQKALISHAFRHPRHRYTVESQRNSHNISYETARTDLMNLRDRGLLDATKISRTWIFVPKPDLHDLLRELK